MVKLGRSLLFAMLLFAILCGSVFAQTVTQETYDRLEIPAAKGIMYGAIDASAAFQELGQDISLINDKEWQERWYNAGFLIGWHGDALVKMDSGGNKFLEGVRKAAQDIMDGYDAVDMGIKQKNDNYIQVGAKSLVAGVTQLVTIYALVDPNAVEEIRGYQDEKLGHSTKSSDVVKESPTLTPTPVIASVVVSGTVGTVNKSANLRAGPGTSYAVAGGAKAGDKVKIIGKNADGSWLQLDNKVWIAAFLVNQGQTTAQSTQVSVQATPAPTTTAAAPTATPTVASVVKQPPKVPYWGDVGMQTCGGFEWRLANVRRSKDAWYYDRKQTAQGEYLIVYVEVKNITGSTASFWEAEPSMPGKDIAERASQYAAWMMTGGFNTLWKDDVAPGEFITLVGAFDVVPDTHTYLFGALSCEQIVAIGSWFELERGPIKASN